jgi:hypothetical protein
MQASPWHVIKTQKLGLIDNREFQSQDAGESLGVEVLWNNM